MGRERWYVAIPDGCDLLERCKEDPEWGDCLMSPSFFRGGGRGRLTVAGFLYPPRTPLEVEFCEAVGRLNAAHPGLETRVLDLDRKYDKLHYLLSWQRRRDGCANDGGRSMDDWGSKAICGASSLPKHLEGGQGHPIRYSDSLQTLEIAIELSTTTLKDLRLYYNPEDMVEKGVYKFGAGNESLIEEQWETICKYFERMKAFYAEVADCEEGVLAIVT